MTDENKALMRRWHEEMNAHNLDACDAMLDDAYTDRNNLCRVPLDKASMKSVMARMFAAVPDLRREVIEQVTEADAVVERLRYTGTHSGEMAGIAATGRSVAFEGVMRSRIRDGKIVEIWALLDSMLLMQQLGVMPVLQSRR